MFTHSFHFLLHTLHVFAHKLVYYNGPCDDLLTLAIVTKNRSLYIYYYLYHFTLHISLSYCMLLSIFNILSFCFSLDFTLHTFFYSTSFLYFTFLFLNLFYFYFVFHSFSSTCFSISFLLTILYLLLFNFFSFITCFILLYTKLPGAI